MGRETGISWTDSTWNPIRGCSRVSEGCRHCYAESVAHRFSGPGLAYEGLVQLDAAGKSTGKWNGQIKFVAHHLFDPLKWKEPRKIFVNSMSDLFHENVTDSMLDSIANVMVLAYWHTFQILTKRPQNFHRLEAAIKKAIAANMELQEFGGMATRLEFRAVDMRHRDHIGWAFPLNNIRIGVSVENQKAADDRLDYLCELASQGWQTMVSFEPLLSAVDPGAWWLSLGARTWAIVGGESGPEARPMHPDWARSLRDQCKAAGVPFFFKQWGEWLPCQPESFSEWKFQTGKHIDRHGIPDMDDPDVKGWNFSVFHEGDDICCHHRVGTKAAGCLLDGVEHHEFPAVPA